MRIETPSRFPWLHAITFISLATLVVYLPLLRAPLFLCEYTSYYAANAQMTLGQLLSKYLPIHPGWYRPTTHFTYFQLLQEFVDWHDFFTIRLIAIAHMIILGGAVAAIAHALFQRGRAAIVAGVLAATHPIQALQVVDLIHYDTIYQTALLLLFLWFLRPASPVKSARWVEVFGAVALWILAITSKEPAIGISGWLIGVYLATRRVPGWNQFNPMNSPAKTGMALFVVLSSVGLMVVRITMGGWDSSGEYRVGLDLHQVGSNLVAAVLWPFNILPWATPSFPGYADAHRHIASLVVGFLTVGGFLIGVLHLWRTGGQRNRFILFHLFLWFVAMSAIPIYSGGRPWHFGPSQAAIALLAGLGLDLALERIRRYRIRALTLSIVCCFYIVTTAHSMLADRAMRKNPQEWVRSALDDPPVAPEALPENAKIYYEVGANSWALGAGDLWKFVYLRPALREFALESISSLEAREIDHILLYPESVFFFQFDSASAPHWRDTTEEFLELLRDQVGDPSKRTVIIDFGAATANYRTEGIGEPEGVSRWAVDDASMIEVPLPENLLDASSLNLEITGRPFFPDGHPGLELTLRVGDLEWKKPFARPADRGWQTIRWTIPKRVLPGDGLLRLQFEWKGAMAPADFSESSDGRKLAFAFKTLVLTPTDEN